MITEFKDSEGEVNKLKPDFFTLITLLKVLRLEHDHKPPENEGFPETHELLDAALWIANELDHAAVNIANELVRIRESTRAMQCKPDVTA
jgi:hypothetical protein